jgi:hypothetical protein
MNFGDIIDVQRLSTLARLRNGQYSVVLLPTIVVLTGAAGAAVATYNATRGPNWLIIVAGALFALAVFAVSGLNRASRMAQFYQANGPTTCTVTDQGLQMPSAVDSGLQPWSAFAGYVDAPSRILLLRPGRGLFNITKAGLSGVETAQLLSIFSKNLRQL